MSSVIAMKVFFLQNYLWDIAGIEARPNPETNKFQWFFLHENKLICQSEIRTTINHDARLSVDL